MNRTFLLFLGVVAVSIASVWADDGSEAPSKKLKTSDIGALKFRSIGPALMSGRIADIAVDPVKPSFRTVGFDGLEHGDRTDTSVTDRSGHDDPGLSGSR